MLPLISASGRVAFQETHVQLLHWSPCGTSSSTHVRRRLGWARRRIPPKTHVKSEQVAVVRDLACPLLPPPLAPRRPSRPLTMRSTPRTGRGGGALASSISRSISGSK
ncbi:hypothetical protein E2C01_002643 [Portunus trituberculatus]|uniref:Uncharacterized protein n=1 Tax=Portunus trituberculatus TaxID=210409 RepID=A0A5B7CLS5_PORTR|nr:hypothetical protein [Portunus trituberculatus]